MAETTETVVEQTNEATETATDVTASDASETVDEGTSADVQTGTEEGGTDPTQASSDQEGADGADAAEAEFYLPVYKGQVVPVDPANREEITTLLQLGMKQREMIPLMEELNQLAHDCGAKSIAEFVKNSRDGFDAAALAQAKKDFGDERGQRYFDYKKSEREKAYKLQREEQQQSESAQNKAIEDRLAAEFTELQALRPELGSVKDVPRAVMKIRLETGISLQDAYNRYDVQQQRKIAVQQQAAASAAKAATGSMKSEAETGTSSVEQAFMAGLYNRRM